MAELNETPVLPSPYVRRFSDYVGLGRPTYRQWASHTTIKTDSATGRLQHDRARGDESELAQDAAGHSRSLAIMNPDDEMEVDTTDTRCGRGERARKALQVLRLGRISLDCILDILDPSKTHLAVYRRLFFNDCGRAHLLRWMEPHAIELVPDKITSEMDNVKSALTGTISSITPESLLAWDVNMFIGTLVEEAAPITGHMLKTAAQTERAKQQNKIKSCSTACNVIVTQLAKERSQLSLYFAAPLTLCLWTNGASRQTIEALHKCGLCISFISLTKLLNNLATQTLERAAHVARGPHIMCYDNINISTSIFVEQRASAPAKVQSGTFAVLYEVRNGNPTHMHLSPILAQAQQASDLTFNRDVQPSRDQMKSYHSQLRIHIINILLDFCKAFQGYKRPCGPILQHPECRMPKGYQTKQYPICTSTINESSITGNIAVIHDVYINQLKMTHELLAD
ncbi:hypothetical protein BS17DRAFT_878968 [Gyrodon lividus]|nr:hypothetical protein BS17DRAFT_878968 [Gyrodon lividus]